MRQPAVSDPTRLLTREFFTLGVVTALFFGAMGAANPILPRFVADELHGSDTAVGVVAGSLAVSSLFARPLFGRLSDRLGARHVLAAACLLGALGYGAFALAGSIPTAVLARLPVGAANAAVMSGATALALELAPPARRGEATSYVFLTFHLGLGLGPPLGELLRDATSYTGVWIALAVVMGLGGAVAFALPRRTPTYDASSPAPMLHRNGVAPGVVFALATTSFVAFSTFAPLYADQIGLREVGLVFTVASVSIVVVRLLTGRSIDRHGPVLMCSVAICTVVAGCAVLAGWRSPAGLFAGAAVLAAGSALVMPSLIAAAIDGVEPHRRSSAIATFTMFIDVANALTGPLFGLLASHAGYRATFVGGGIAAIAALAVVRTVLAPRWARREVQVATAA